MRKSAKPAETCEPDKNTGVIAESIRKLRMVSNRKLTMVSNRKLTMVSNRKILWL